MRIEVVRSKRSFDHKEEVNKILEGIPNDLKFKMKHWVKVIDHTTIFITIITIHSKNKDEGPNK